MAMIVKNNMGAQRTLNTLNKNSKKMGKALSKVSTGMKIVGADDDASGYAISEKMREQIRSLDQDSQNVQYGSSLFRIAAGGIENIVEELRTLKELAIKSANDTNNDGDRATIQKEFDQRMATINDIATETNYNGKALLSGDYARMVIVGQDVKEYSKIIGYNTRTIKFKKPSYTRILVPVGVTDIKENNKNSNLTKNFKSIDSSMTTLNSPTSMRGIQCDIGFKGGSWNWADAMKAKTPGVNFTNDSNNSVYLSSSKQIGVSMDFTFGSTNPTIQDLDGEGFNIQCGEKNTAVAIST